MKTYTATFEIEGVGEVEFTGLVELENQGIGAYEYQGYKGRDTNYQPVCDWFNYQWKEYGKKEIKKIAAFIKANEKKIRAAIEEQFDSE